MLKQIAYAHPSSPNAEQAGKPDGCWVLTLRRIEWGSSKFVAGFDTPEEAWDYAIKHHADVVWSTYTRSRTGDSYYEEFSENIEENAATSGKLGDGPVNLHRTARAAQAEVRAEIEQEIREEGVRYLVGEADASAGNYWRYEAERGPRGGVHIHRERHPGTVSSEIGYYGSVVYEPHRIDNAATSGKLGDGPERKFAASAHHVSGGSLDHCCTTGISSDPSDGFYAQVEAASPTEAMVKASAAWSLYLEEIRSDCGDDEEGVKLDYEPCACGKADGTLWNSWHESVTVSIELDEEDIEICADCGGEPGFRGCEECNNTGIIEKKLE